MMSEEKLVRRIRILLGIVTGGLIISGISVIFLETTFRLLTGLFGIGAEAQPENLSGFLGWLVLVRNAIIGTNAQYPFLAYATDWLAFAHFIIAFAFIAPLKNPARHIWTISWGMIACAAVFPTAFIAGYFRGIPFYWQLFSCSFGLIALIPLWFSRKFARRLNTG
jgi:hypothetical protein